MIRSNLEKVFLVRHSPQSEARWPNLFDGPGFKVLGIQEAYVCGLKLGSGRRTLNQNQHFQMASTLFRFIVVLCICLAIHGVSQADEHGRLDEIMAGFEEETPVASDPALDDIMEGFEDDVQVADTVKPPAKASAPITLNGHLKIGAAYNYAHPSPEAGETDWRGLSRLKSEAALELRSKWHDRWRLLVGGKYYYDWAYSLKGRDEFTDEVLDQYEQETELGEAYIQGSLHPHLDLKAGRQIVVWGRSDNIRITDVLNPLDFREPGLTDIEDLRLPVTMTRMDGYWGPWNLTAIAGHEVRFNKNPVFGHDFFPGTTPLPPEEKPDCGASHTEWALALNGIFSGKDLSFYWADLYDENTFVEMTPKAELVRKHARVTMWGAAGNLAKGDWLFIGEMAYWQRLKFFNAPGQTFERLDGLVGMEYSGWAEMTVSLDFAVRHIIDFDARIGSAPDFAQEDTFETTLRISKNYLNDTLDITLLAMMYGPLGQGGALERISIKYDWNDALSSTIGLALYQSGDRFILNDINDNDRLFLDIKYSF